MGLPNAIELPFATLTQWFEAQVEQVGEAAVALASSESRLTYGELSRRANQLAEYLVAIGVGPEQRVGLCMERGLEVVVAVLGILKAGGAYVPLDPGHPAERLKFLANDAQLSILVTDGRVDGDKLAGVGSRIVNVEAERERISRGRGDNLPCCSTADHLAYVIYTSGSTGKPKGVEVTHGNVMRLFTVTAPWFAFTAKDVWTLFHSYSFDFSVWELWGALLHGGKLVVVSQMESRYPQLFYDMLQQHRVTVLNQTPSAFRQLLEVDEKRRESLALRLVIFGGEALDASMLQGWRERHSTTRLVNMYGITEITVHGTYVELGDREIGARESVIGEALPDLQLYVVGDGMELAPGGGSGELYVGGEGVARGYLNRPELTAERFVPDRYSGQPGARLYRTGDKVRRRLEGGLAYLGRIDDQVKIRGYRIELGEVEAALREHPEVAQAVVVAREEADAKRLVAYIVPRGRSNCRTDALKAHLAQRLPEYMLPAHYMFLDSLPLTLHGKLDKSALPALDTARAGDVPELIKPRTAVEEVLCGIWAHVLAVDEVGVEDDFFEFGGHSLLATQVISQVRRVFGLEISLHLFFEAPTVAMFARELEKAHAEQPGEVALMDETENPSAKR